MLPEFLSPHFSLAELTQSQSAARVGLDNTPTPEIVTNLARVASVLEQARVILGVPILISSGYRSPELNARTPGSSKTSAHMQGLAVDFTAPKFGTPFHVAAALADSSLQFDQIIQEYGKWVHLGLAPLDKMPRRMCLSIFSGTGYLPGLLATAP